MSGIGETQFGQLPAVRISAADGAQATVTLFGGHLVSWRTADGVERLFVSARSALDGSKPIRGGVPLVFPQFNERGPLLKHGFARVSQWRLGKSGDEDGAAFAEFELAPADLPAALAQAWPHSFALRLRVAVRAGELRLDLDVENTGNEAFSFATALHTYFSIARIGDVSIGGVQRDRLRIAGKLDHVFARVPGDITLDTGAGSLRLEQSGFRDAVVWNPGPADAAAMADLDDEDYDRFVCIEPSVIEPPFDLPARHSWKGVHTIKA